MEWRVLTNLDNPELDRISRIEFRWVDAIYKERIVTI